MRKSPTPVGKWNTGGIFPRCTVISLNLRTYLLLYQRVKHRLCFYLLSGAGMNHIPRREFFFFIQWKGWIGKGCEKGRGEGHFYCMPRQISPIIQTEKMIHSITQWAQPCTPISGFVSKEQQAVIIKKIALCNEQWGDRLLAMDTHLRLWLLEINRFRLWRLEFGE